MSKIIYPLASSTWGPEEIGAIQKVISTDMYTMGNHVKKFEQEYAERFEVDHAIMVNSGSSANLLMFALLKQRYKLTGDVIVPAVGWSTSYYPVNQAGFKLNFVDVDPNTFNIDVTKIEQAITPNTCAILAINMFGNSCDYEEIHRIAIKHNLKVLEDNCESMGSKFNGRYTGSMGLFDRGTEPSTYGYLGSQSFFFSHHMQTMEGGMITTDSWEDADYLRSLRAHGWMRDWQGDPEQPGKMIDIGPEKVDPWKKNFTFVAPGYTVRPLEFSGAIGSEQLKKWDGIMDSRLKNKDYFFEKFADQDYLRFQTEIHESSWFTFSCICTGALRGRRDEVVSALTDAGVQSRPMGAGNWLRQPVLESMDYIAEGTYEAADEIEDEGFFVGNGLEDVTKGIDVMYNTIQKLL